ncbi:response regulator transcription factor [Moheibacter lacus]|uniref:Response regulator transcription factor n=1 Tax=Moheibacter lacus TaxID=2745851 RepID=A0A838ZMA5_9FLAO|nr:response regulator transcription factor [Moheibacter lacus]MBA5629654.1 response regulator transcription factor [Moheibacter lacus]
MKEKILIIEDEIIIANNLKIQLESQNFSAEIATSPEIAIGLSQEIDFQLVLTDINLEHEIDGIHLISKLNLKPSIPVIFLTAYSNREIISRAGNEQPYAFLIKPFHNEQLFLTIKMALLHSKKKFIHNPEKIQSDIKLGKRELEIIKLLSQSKTSEEIAEELNISPLTVSTHRKNIFRKTASKNMIELISLAVENRWI